MIGAWRPVPPPLEVTVDELELVTPTLLETGAGALAWSRVRNSRLATTPAGSELEDAYRLYALQSIRFERDISGVFDLLRFAGVEPILVKGWAAAQLYPEKGLRPSGDIDLCVGPADYRSASTLLRNDGKDYWVDLHYGFDNLDTRSWEEINARSRLIKTGNTEVRIPSEEDHLRMLSFHFLREGAWRPLWLCDVAAAVESQTKIDWDLFLGPDKKRRAWFASVIVLAQRLLDANLDHVPAEVRNQKLPSWLLPAVLKAWEVRGMSKRHMTPMATAWRKPFIALRGLSSHWPNPIEGTIGVKASFNEIPRLPFQLGNCVLRVTNYALRSAGVSTTRPAPK
jgi:Uncharacterised nucleotidyltransferase